MTAPGSGLWARLKHALRWSLTAVASEHQAAPAAPVSQREWLMLGLLLVVGLALRAGLAIAFPSIYHADEQFQYWEQGFRLIHGYGVVPWEYREGIRSYAVPGLLAGAFGLARQLGGDTETGRVLGNLLLSALSLTTVVTAYFWARRTAGVTAALVAGFVACVWYELVYFGPKPFTEVVAAAALFPAAYLLCAVPEPTRRHLLAGGALLGAAFALRFQLAPAVIVVLAAALLRSRRGGLLVMTALLVVGVAARGLGWLALGAPVPTILLHFSINPIAERASNFGARAPLWDLLYFANAWPGLVAILLLLFTVGLRRAPLLFTLPLVIVLSHSLIGHKEYRFVYPALPFLMTLASIGSVLALEMASRSLGANWRRRAVALLMVGWFVASASIALSDGTRTRLMQGNDVTLAFGAAGKIENACGVGLAGIHWGMATGYSTLGRDVPVYPIASREEAQERADAYNVLIRAKGRIDLQLPSFAQNQCFGDVCVETRAGSCVQHPEATINSTLVQAGE